MRSIREAQADLKPAAIDGALDHDLGEVEDPYPLVPEGIYDVTFIKDHLMKIGKAHRLVLYFQLCDLSSEYHGTILIMGVNLPKNGKKKWGPLSKMAECYRVAAGRNPDRFDVGRVSTNVFKGKILSARVVTVTRGVQQQERDPALFYSVIDKLVSPKTDRPGINP